MVIMMSNRNSGIEIDHNLVSMMGMMGVDPNAVAAKMGVGSFRPVERSDFGDFRKMGGKGSKVTAETEPSQRNAHRRGARHANVLAPPMVPSTASADGVCGADVERDWPSAADMGGHGRTRA